MAAVGVDAQDAVLAGGELHILGRLSLLLAMAHHERAIRLLADHLGFSIVHSALLTASDMADIVA